MAQCFKRTGIKDHPVASVPVLMMDMLSRAVYSLSQAIFTPGIGCKKPNPACLPLAVIQAVDFLIPAMIGD